MFERTIVVEFHFDQRIFVVHRVDLDPFEMSRLIELELNRHGRCVPAQPTRLVTTDDSID